MSIRTVAITEVCKGPVRLKMSAQFDWTDDVPAEMELDLGLYWIRIKESLEFLRKTKGDVSVSFKNVDGGILYDDHGSRMGKNELGFNLGSLYLTVYSTGQAVFKWVLRDSTYEEDYLLSEEFQIG